MLYSSFVFIFLFLPLVILLYYLVKNRTIKNLILCAFSIIFYAWGEPKYILLMIITILINYYLTILMDKSKKHRKFYMILITIIDLSILGFFKYLNFFIDTTNSIFNFNIKFFNIVLPIGISFYTFQILSYVIDVYRKETKVQKNLLNLATYVCLFPQLVAGPIVRYQTVQDELENRKESLEQFVIGARRFMIGFAKKILIANNMALICDNLYSNISSLGTLSLWIAAISYTFQIYFDFSGYSDMAIGLGKIFGFNFLENFNYPYIATSITDFWRRWHISLSTWFRDYVYIPLGGNRVSKLKWIRNILVVWILTGFWHGASYNYIIWGLYYGILLLIEKLFLSKILDKIPKFFRHIYTLFIIVIGWTIFRLENINDLLFALKNMFNIIPSNFLDYILENSDILSAIPFVIFAIIGSIPIYKKISSKLSSSKFGMALNDLYIFLIYIISILYLVSSTYNPFIYFRF